MTLGWETISQIDSSTVLFLYETYDFFADNLNRKLINNRLAL